MPSWRNILVISLLLAPLALLQPLNTYAASDLTTHYRVYQNNHLLMEFPNATNAINYAKRFTDSYVEEIGSRNWIWNNFPSYRLYQNGSTLPQWEYSTFAGATAEAQNWGNSSVRDLSSGGWVYNNYPRFSLYQGETTSGSWQFQSLQAAINEAGKWANAHIIDLSNNHWVWDNLSAAAKTQLRAGTLNYQVYQGTNTNEAWKFAYFEDAVNEALKWKNSTIVPINGDNHVIFSNMNNFQVYQKGRLLQDFTWINDAIAYASRWDHSTIMVNGKEIWNNSAYYQVYQYETMIGEYHSIADSLSFAKRYDHVRIQTYDKQIIWDNNPKLIYWGWNGTSSQSVIQTQIANTQGLDVDSPSWFTLSDADGNIIDYSSPSAADSIKQRSIAVQPLISNQFDSTLTSAFLRNTAAQARFTDAIVTRCATLGVSGVNIDFESMNGNDRDLYTAFLSSFTAAAHLRGLTVSVDLPRGSVVWDDKTAFDHKKLAQIVDYIMIMTYDQFEGTSTSPGSVAGLQWVEQGVQEFLAYGIPRGKLLLGIPFYVRQWQLDSYGKIVGSTALFMKNLPDLISSKHAVILWDPIYNQNKVTYQENGFTYVFWMEDQDTINARLQIVKNYNLAGAAIWRLGYERTDLWTMMLRLK